MQVYFQLPQGAAGAVSPPTIPVDQPNPRGPRSVVALMAQPLGTLLCTALLGAGLGDAGLLRQPPFDPLPRAIWRVPLSDPPNLLTTTLGGPALAPFKPIEFPNPRGRPWPMPPDPPYRLGALSTAGTKPFLLSDWPNPDFTRVRVHWPRLDLPSLQATTLVPPPRTIPFPPADLPNPARPWNLTALWSQPYPVRPLPNVAQPPTIQPVPHNAASGSWNSWLIQIARNSNLQLDGKINATVRIVLQPGATSTTLTDSRIGLFSHIVLSPLSASAAAILATGGVWFEPTTGSCTIHHPVSGAFDMTCSALIIG